MPQGSMRYIGNGRMIHNRAEDLAVYRALLANRAKQYFKVVTLEPVAIEIEFGLLRPKSVKRNLPTVPPDLDKLIRAVLDSLTGIAYQDDSQVVRIVATKVYSPAYYVKVRLNLGSMGEL